MGRRIALLSGGKDSFYAAMHYWPPDIGLVMTYESPEPSPHIVNLGKTVETLTLAGVPVLVIRLPRRRERETLIQVLRLLNASELVAGDVYIEDHLRYMEGVAADSGAKLRESLWSRDPTELLYEIIEAGLVPLIIGARPEAARFLGTVLGNETVDSLAREARENGWDPLGENGEYHTILLDSPHHTRRLSYTNCGLIESGSITITRLC